MKIKADPIKGDDNTPHMIQVDVFATRLLLTLPQTEELTKAISHAIVQLAIELGHNVEVQ